MRSNIFCNAALGVPPTIARADKVQTTSRSTGHPASSWKHNLYAKVSVRAEFRLWMCLVHRLKQREKEQMYSKAQAAAKRRAAEALQQQKDSRSGANWFSRVAQSLGVHNLGAMAARCSTAGTTPSSCTVLSNNIF